jgi:hypothetical protein
MRLFTVRLALVIVLIFAWHTVGVTRSADGCGTIATALKHPNSSNLRILLVVDDFACSRCVRELLNHVSAVSHPSRIAVIFSSSQRALYESKARKLKCLVVTSSTAELQECLPSEHAVALYTFTPSGYRRLLDVAIDEVDAAKEKITSICSD